MQELALKNVRDLKVMIQVCSSLYGCPAKTDAMQWNEDNKCVLHLPHQRSTNDEE